MANMASKAFGLVGGVIGKAVTGSWKVVASPVTGVWNAGNLGKATVLAGGTAVAALATKGVFENGERERAAMKRTDPTQAINAQNAQMAMENQQLAAQVAEAEAVANVLVSHATGNMPQPSARGAHMANASPQAMMAGAPDALVNAAQHQGAVESRGAQLQA